MQKQMARLRLVCATSKLRLVERRAAVGDCLCDNLAPSLFHLKSWNLSELHRDMKQVKNEKENIGKKTQKGMSLRRREKESLTS